MTEEQEIRAKALELAIKANLTRPSGTADLIDVSQDFAEYIAGPTPTKPQVFGGDEEPPIGRYTDCDGDLWRHVKAGWYFRNGSVCEQWDSVKNYQPFTKVEG